MGVSTSAASMGLFAERLIQPFYSVRCVTLKHEFHLFFSSLTLRNYLRRVRLTSNYPALWDGLQPICPDFTGVDWGYNLT